MGKAESKLLAGDWTGKVNKSANVTVSEGGYDAGSSVGSAGRSASGFAASELGPDGKPKPGSKAYFASGPPPGLGSSPAALAAAAAASSNSNSGSGSGSGGSGGSASSSWPAGPPGMGDGNSAPVPAAPKRRPGKNYAALPVMKLWKDYGSKVRDCVPLAIAEQACRRTSARSVA